MTCGRNECRLYLCGQPTRAKIAVEDCYRDIDAHQKLIIPPNVLKHLDSCPSELDNIRFDGQEIIQFSRPAKIHAASSNSQNDIVIGTQAIMIEPDGSQQFGAAAFGKAQIIGVIDNPGGVGVFVIDAELAAMPGHDQLAGVSNKS